MGDAEAAKAFLPTSQVKGENPADPTRNNLNEREQHLARYLSRIIGHVDLDYFYAQVEELQNPSLKKRPVVVCVFSGRTNDSGVVSTANYMAREYGVRSGIPIAVAKQKLAGVGACFLPMTHEKYKEVSERIMMLVKTKVDVLEQTGIDEAFFDITKISQTDIDKAQSIALEIKRDIFQKEGLTSSVGIGPNKLVAKIASDFRKPDGLTVVRPEDVRVFLSTLPVKKLYGVGQKTNKVLTANGINAIGELADTKLERLEQLFSRKISLYLHQSALGIDEEPVMERGEALQISRIITLKQNSRDMNDVRDQLAPAIDDVWKKSLERKLGFKSIAVIGIATDLSIRTRNKTLEFPINNLESLRNVVFTLLQELLNDTDRELRRAGVRISNFTSTKDQGSILEYTRP